MKFQSTNKSNIFESEGNHTNNSSQWFTAFTAPKVHFKNPLKYRFQSPTSKYHDDVYEHDF